MKFQKLPNQRNQSSHPQEISLGQLLVQKYSKKQFDIGDYSDNYVKELEKLIDAKIKGKTFVSQYSQGESDQQRFLEALKASVEIKGNKIVYYPYSI